MLRQKIIKTAVIVLFAFSAKLGLADNQGRFNLKEGDWFEMRLGIDIHSEMNQFTSGNFMYSTRFEPDLYINMRYQLTKQLVEGNQIFELSIKRIQAKTEGFVHSFIGYDSFYPEYQDNLKTNDSFSKFQLEVKSDGELVRFESINDNSTVFTLNQIDPKTSMLGIKKDVELSDMIFQMYSAFIMYLPENEKEKYLRVCSSDKVIESKIVRQKVNEDYEDYYLLFNNVPHRFSILKKQHVLLNNEIVKLVDASFPIPANTLIKGNLPKYANEKVAIKLEGDRDEKYFNHKTISINEEGSFEFPLFLNQSYYLELGVGDVKTKFFIEPFDTLEIWKINEQKLINGTDFSSRTAETGHLLEADIYGGNAAYNARLSSEMEEWIPERLPLPNNVEDYKRIRNTVVINTNILFKLYEYKASQKCIEYFKNKIKFYLVADKLHFEKQSYLTQNPYDREDKSPIYPSGFFDEVDSITTVMYPYKWCKYYNRYLDYAHDYKQRNVSMPFGGFDKGEDSFWGRYYFARAALKGYPMYLSLNKAFDKELRNGYEAVSRIEPLYRDFINNCRDTSLTKPIERNYQIALDLAIGEKFPIESFIKTDSSVFKLSDLKGKPICLTILPAIYKYRISEFKKEIEKFDITEVEFVFIVMPHEYYNDLKDSSLLAKSNVHIVDVIEPDLEQRLLYNKYMKVFVFDKWLRIVGDDVQDPAYNKPSNDFEKTIRKAIQTKRFSKSQKTAFYKTAGWSLGSILFTVFIGVWIYRIRIRRIKKQETIQRQIKELEIKAIRSQMNPHFIFNALNSIQSLVNGKQYREANIYLAKFSVLLRGVLNNSERNLISLSAELEALKLYCELEQLRFEFQYEIDVEQNINTELIEIPGMVIQPLAENAIVHGLSSIGTQGVLKVKIELTNGCLKVQVLDNGPGLQNVYEDKLSKKGYGLKLVRERLAMTNQHENMAKLSIENNKDGNGAVATLFIPVD